MKYISRVQQLGNLIYITQAINLSSYVYEMHSIAIHYIYCNLIHGFGVNVLLIFVSNISIIQKDLCFLPLFPICSISCKTNLKYNSVI